MLKTVSRAGVASLVLGTAMSLSLPTGPVAAPAAAAGTAAVRPTPSAHSYPVRATLDGRTARKLTNHAVRNKYRVGTRVVVICQASGGKTYNGSTIWDLTQDGFWIPDYYVGTGYTGFAPTIPRCAIPKSYRTLATLDGRRTKSLSNRARPNRYRVGSTVRITCQAFGGATYRGSYLWDRTTDGLWISDYYVNTGRSGLVPGLPRCDTDRPPGNVDGSRRVPADLQLSMAGLAFTVSYERFVDRAYNDRPGRLGNCTAGYGHLLHRGPCTPSDFNAYRTVSRERALGWLYEDVNNAARTLRGEVGRTPLHQREFDALSDLVFNIGAGYFSKSNVKLDLLATPPRYRSVPKDLLSLVNGHGVKLCGLYRRRVDNGRTFVSGTYARTYATCPPGHV